MAIIRVKRTSEYIGAMSDYKIYIDHQQVGKIANGETKDFTSTVGHHIVTAKIDWCRSPDISIAVIENQTCSLKVSGSKNKKLLMLIGLGLIILHCILSTFTDLEFTKLLAVPFFVVIFYYLTFGRKNI